MKHAVGTTLVAGSGRAIVRSSSRSNSAFAAWQTLVTVPRYQVGRILLAAAGFPHDRFEAEDFVLRFRSVLLTQPFKKQLGRSPAQFAYGLAHHGKARVQQGG
jgi:hypothetical protein